MIFLTTGNMIKPRSVGVYSTDDSPLEWTNCSKYNCKSVLATLLSCITIVIVLPLPLLT